MKGLCSACGLRIHESIGCTGTEWPLANGQYAQPVPYGQEKGQWEGYALTHPNCPDCGVVPGMPHHIGCEVEQIPEGVETEDDAYRREHPDGEEAPEAETEIPELRDSGIRGLLSTLFLRGTMGWILRSPGRLLAAAALLLVVYGAVTP